MQKAPTLIWVGAGVGEPTLIWPPASEVIAGTATGRIAGTAVPLVTGHGGLVAFTPAHPQPRIVIFLVAACSAPQHSRLPAHNLNSHLPTAACLAPQQLLPAGLPQHIWQSWCEEVSLVGKGLLRKGLHAEPGEGRAPGGGGGS